MEIKGLAFLGRKDSIIKEFGEDAWNKFIEKLSQNEPYFKSSILTSTSMPAEKFLFFQEAVAKEFYKGDPKSYWMNGEKSAEFALIHGPYKVYLSSKNVTSFVEERIPLIWKMYYSEGAMNTKVEGNVVDITITGVSIPHIYFEYVTLGFAKKSIELVGAKIVETKKIKGPSMGTKDTHYQFIIEQ